MRYILDKITVTSKNERTGKFETKKSTSPHLDFSADIKRGASLLDKHFGPEWDERIRPGSLNLASGTSCVLGQVFVKSFIGDVVSRNGAHYNGGINFLFGGAGDNEFPMSYKHGFHIDEDAPAYEKYATRMILMGYESPSAIAWESLTHQWIDYIKERQEMRGLIKQVKEAGSQAKTIRDELAEIAALTRQS